MTPLLGKKTKLVKKLKEEVKDKHEQLLRVSADFENYKKRSAREKSDLRKFANESLLKDLLVTADNMGQALSLLDSKYEYDAKIIKGIDLSLKGLLKTFDKFGVVQLDSVGKPFDPNYHQAIMQKETDQYPQNTVVEEFQKGYTLNGRLLRPSMAVVSK